MDEPAGNRYKHRRFVVGPFRVANARPMKKAFGADNSSIRRR